jgi:hypothetical protein
MLTVSSLRWIHLGLRKKEKKELGSRKIILQAEL